MEKVINNPKFRDQLNATIVDSVNQQRIADELEKLKIQDINFSKALFEIHKVKEYIGTPENILGNPNTKHGEIAEQVEVGVRRAMQALNGESFTATFEGIGRTAPVDYISDGIDVQSKFINGTNNGLRAVIQHFEMYPEFGGENKLYHIPKDQFEIIEKLLNGEDIPELSSRTKNAILRSVGKIEEMSGKKFQDAVNPSISEYADVQQGKIHETMNKHEDNVKKENTAKKAQISEEHKPNLNEGLQTAGTAAAFGATISITTSFYKKYKQEGKRFYKGEFTRDDWAEIGLDTGKDAILTGVSSLAIYGMTNYANLSAPLAGSVVSATKGVSSLYLDYQRGDIEFDEFYELSMITCFESAVVTLTTISGQALIPIPVIGGLIGSFAGTLIMNAIGENDKATANMIRKDMDEYMSMLDEKYQTLVKSMQDEFSKLGDLTEAAFNLENNQKLLSFSVDLAIAYGIHESELLKNTSEVDAFMLG